MTKTHIINLFNEIKTIPTGVYLRFHATKTPIVGLKII